MTSSVGPGSQQNSRTVTIPKGGREIGKVQAGLDKDSMPVATTACRLGICCFTLALREQCLLLAAWESGQWPWGRQHDSPLESWLKLF